MLIVSGSFNPVNGSYKMENPEFPYGYSVYMGYSLKAMKRKFRKDHKLERKHII